MPPLVRTLGQGEYLGAPRRSFAAHGIHVNESVYAPGVWLPPHRHRASNYCFLLAGGFRETSGRTRRRECARPDVLFRPPDEEHEQWFGPKGGRCLNVELSMPFLDRYGDLLHPLQRPIHVDSAELFVLGRRLQTELKRPDAITTLAVEGLALEMLSLSLRLREYVTSTPPRWLLDAQRLVKERFKTRLTLVELALAVGVHPAHLSRSFRRHFGTSVAACIRRERLTWACRLLSETRLPVHEIALQAGYADQSHLTRALRLATGLTPAVYRRRFGSARSKMRA